MPSFSAFLKKANTPKALNNASAFLTNNAEFIQAHFPNEVFVGSDDEILEQLKSKLCQAILNKPKREPKTPRVPRTRTIKNYTATIYDVQGYIIWAEDREGELRQLEAGFDLPQRANGWADRKLFDQAPGSYCEIVHAHSNSSYRISREEAVSRTLRSPRQGASRRMFPAQSGLQWGVRSKPSNPSFSAG